MSDTEDEPSSQDIIEEEVGDEMEVVDAKEAEGGENEGRKASGSESSEESDDEDESDSSDDESDSNDDESDNEDEFTEDDRYQFEPKVRPIYNAFKKANSCVCIRPGTYVTIDEMMVRFKGKSRETYRMCGKPIREGYKFFALCDAESKFIWRIFPYGRVSTKCGIITTVVDQVKSLPDRGIKYYVCAMDNYFTYHSVINKCVDAHVHVCGTAKAKRGWPPAVIKSQNDGRFNSLHHITVKSGKSRFTVG